MPTHLLPRRLPLLPRRLPLSLALLSLLVSPFSDIECRAQAPPRPPPDCAPSRLGDTGDPGIAPGDDFFAYANGAWLDAAVIPPGKDRWSVRDDINERTRRQIA